MSFLIYVGMGGWMASKREVKVGDFVEYKDGQGVVCDSDGVPLRVIEIKRHDTLGKLCVYYNNGNFDYLKSVKKVSSLVWELM